MCFPQLASWFLLSFFSSDGYQGPAELSHFLGDVTLISGGKLKVAWERDQNLLLSPGCVSKTIYTEVHWLLHCPPAQTRQCAWSSANSSPRAPFWAPLPLRRERTWSPAPGLEKSRPDVGWVATATNFYILGKKKKRSHVRAKMTHRLPCPRVPTGTAHGSGVERVSPPFLTIWGSSSHPTLPGQGPRPP